MSEKPVQTPSQSPVKNISSSSPPKDRFKLEFDYDDEASKTKWAEVLPAVVIQDTGGAKTKPGIWWDVASAKSKAAARSSKPIMSNQKFGSVDLSTEQVTSPPQYDNNTPSSKSTESPIATRRVSGTLLRFVQRDSAGSKYVPSDSSSTECKTAIQAQQECVVVAPTVRSILPPPPDSINSRKFGKVEKHRVVRVIAPQKGKAFTDFSFLKRDRSDEVGNYNYNSLSSSSGVKKDGSRRKISAIDVAGASSGEDNGTLHRCETAYCLFISSFFLFFAHSCPL